MGDNPTLYGYAHDPNSWIDVFGLMLINPNAVFFSQNRFVTQADLNAEAKLNGEFPINLNKRFSTENAGRSIEVKCG
jgi:hypothetical protein